MPNLGEASWNDWMDFMRALDAAGSQSIENVRWNYRHAEKMVQALRRASTDAAPPKDPKISDGRSGYLRGDVSNWDDLRKTLERAGLTAAELRLAARADVALAMVKALKAARHHDIVTPPTNWLENDYLAIGSPGFTLYAAEPSRSRAKDLAIARGCSAPLVVHASRIRDRSAITIIAAAAPA